MGDGGNKMTDKLKPCPFCGGEAEITYCDEGCCGAKPYEVYCDCGAHISAYEKSIKAWNTRVQ